MAFPAPSESGSWVLSEGDCLFECLLRLYRRSTRAEYKKRQVGLLREPPRRGPPDRRTRRRARGRARGAGKDTAGALVKYIVGGELSCDSLATEDQS